MFLCMKPFPDVFLSADRPTSVSANDMSAYSTALFESFNVPQGPECVRGIEQSGGLS